MTWRVVTLSHHSAHRNNSIRFKTNIARFAFLFNALDDEQLVLLSLHNTNLSLINMFKHKKPWLKVRYDEKTIPYDRASGYFVFKRKMHQFQLDLGNCFLTGDRELMSSLYFCDQLVNCTGVNISVTKGKMNCKDMNICLSEPKTKYDGLCPPLLYLEITGKCSSYTSQVYKMYTNGSNQTFPGSRHHAENVIQTMEINYQCQGKSVSQEKSFISVILLNDGVPDCPEEDDESVLRSNVFISKNQEPCRLNGMMSCYPSINKCFTIQDICLYKLDKLDHLYPCRTGSHIKYCEDFQCNQNYKCPGYYCVPWRYVCDGKWDCPHGHDEYSDSLKCGQSQKCINMFKCKDSQICIHVHDVCNNFDDCPHMDDEVLCELRDTICPPWCQCLNFAISCQLIEASTDFHLLSLFSSLPFVAYHIVSTGINSISFLKKNTNIAILNVSKNSLTTVCGIVHEFCNLRSIDISANNINEISP